MTVVPGMAHVVMAPVQRVNAMTATEAKVAVMVAVMAVTAAGVVVVAAVAVASVKARVNKVRPPMQASASVSMPKVAPRRKRLL